MTQPNRSDFQPIRDVVLRSFEALRGSVLALTHLVSVEEHPYEWGTTWTVSAISSPVSDEVSATASIRVGGGTAELDADICYDKTIVAFLSPLTFQLADTQGLTEAAEAVGKFFEQTAPRFEEYCIRMVKDWPPMEPPIG